jgi:hypothetical protein
MEEEWNLLEERYELLDKNVKSNNTIYVLNDTRTCLKKCTTNGCDGEGNLNPKYKTHSR